jgi:hypothetical protein
MDRRGPEIRGLFIVKLNNSKPGTHPEMLPKWKNKPLVLSILPINHLDGIFYSYIA